MTVAGPPVDDRIRVERGDITRLAARSPRRATTAPPMTSSGRMIFVCFDETTAAAYRAVLKG